VGGANFNAWIHDLNEVDFRAPKHFMCHKKFIFIRTTQFDCVVYSSGLTKVKQRLNPDPKVDHERLFNQSAPWEMAFNPTTLTLASYS
jgi:hypothetical protein